MYLRTSPEVVYERMRKRARSEESCVPLQYLQELHKLHENWLIENNGYNVDVSGVVKTSINRFIIRTLSRRRLGWKKGLLPHQNGTPFFCSQVVVLNADLDIEHIGSEYKRFENHIINPAFVQQPPAVLVSPSKRQAME